ncbi:MAG: glycoside hydrolase family 28 protein [Bacteroidales bacterium]|nr:glycoside hydrolase family 28 protein [Bacteroidales bacterium]
MQHALLTTLLLALFGAQAFAQIHIPTADEVGPAVMPDTIAPIEAPFDMPQLQRPTFPDYRLPITKKGAKEGRFVRQQIQAAIDDVAARGGGTVVIPKGNWHTGRIELRSNVCLHIEEGANVYFSGDIKDYLPVVFTRSAGIEAMSMGAMIYANGQRNIGLTGTGRLIGPGRDCELWHRNPEYGSFDSRVNYDLPPTERIYDGHDSTCIYLPTFIGPINCSNVLIEGVELSECVFWNIVPTYCDSVIIRGTKVHSVGLPMGDGMDIESSRNVLIEYNFLETGDDNFTIKAGRGIDGLRVNRPSENLVIRRNLTAIGHGGVTCGSETAGMIRDVYVCDNVFAGTNVGFRFKTRRPRGGGGENLYYERNRIRAAKEAIGFDMLGAAMYVGGLSARVPMEVDRFTPTFRNVVIRDLIVEDGTWFLRVIGIPESPARNVTIERVKAHSQRLMQLHDLNMLTLCDAELSADSAVIDISQVRNLYLENVTFDLPEGEEKWQMEPGDNENIFIDGKSLIGPQ